MSNPRPPDHRLTALPLHHERQLSFSLFTLFLSLPLERGALYSPSSSPLLSNTSDMNFSEGTCKASPEGRNIRKSGLIVASFRNNAFDVILIGVDLYYVSIERLTSWLSCCHLKSYLFSREQFTIYKDKSNVTFDPST